MKNSKLIQTSICFFIIALIVMMPIAFAEEIRATDGVILKNSAKNQGSASSKKGSDSGSIVYAFPGLAAWLVALISPYITAIVVGAAVIIVGYVIYRVGYSTWVYYTASTYSSVTDYSLKHINDFPWIWSRSPPPKDFKDKCLKNMNSKSATKYIQNDGRLISYDPSNYMISIGETDGKVVVNCFPAGSTKSAAEKYIAKKVKDGVWKLIK